MATRDWDSSYEATPANTDKRHEGDDRMREIKEDARERLQQGGHSVPGAGIGAPAATTDNASGIHAVDAGGSGVSPDIYKADLVTKLVTYTDALVTVAEPLVVEGEVTVGDGATPNSAEITGDDSNGAASIIHATTPLGLDAGLAYKPRSVTVSGIVTAVDSAIYVNGTGTINVTIEDNIVNPQILIIHKVSGPILTLDSTLGSGIFHTSNGIALGPWTAFEAEAEGTLILFGIGISRRWFVQSDTHAFSEQHSSTGTLTRPTTNAFADTQGGSFTLNLPLRTTEQSPYYCIITNVASANTLTIGTTGGDTISGATTCVLNQSLLVTCAAGSTNYYGRQI